MIFDRISLVDAYAALQITEANEGKLKQVLFNRTAHYGTKTNVRFSSVLELGRFIESEFAFQAFDPNCECGTCNESIWQLLSFTVELPGRRFVTFINNIRGEFESAEAAQLNRSSKAALAVVFKKNATLIRLKKTATCYGYIENQGKYVSPCDYIDLIKTPAHDEVIKLYQSTRNKHGLNRTEVYIDKCNEGIIEKAYKWPDEVEEFPCADFTVSDTVVTEADLDYCSTYEFQLESTSVTDAEAEVPTTTLATTLATTQATTLATTLPTTLPTTTLATTLPTTTLATTLATAATTEATTTQQEWNILLMSGGFSFNGMHWQTANNGGNYDNVPGNQYGFSFTNTLNNGLLDTTLIQNLLDDAYTFEQDTSIFTTPQLTIVAYGGATYFGPGIGQVQVGQQLYDGYTTNPWTQDIASGFGAGAAQISLIQGGNSYVQQIGSDPTLQNDENSGWQNNGGTIRVIEWDANGIVTDVQDFTIPSPPTS